MITTLVSPKQQMLCITPASVKQWQLPVIIQSRTGVNLPKNTFFPSPPLVQHAIYYHVPAITKGSCWSRFAGEIQRLASLTWHSPFYKDHSCSKRETPKMTTPLAKGDRMMHLANPPPQPQSFQRGTAAVSITASEDCSRFSDMIASL